MQLQVECNRILESSPLCLICGDTFEMQQARILICNDQGKSYGEVCPNCIHKGFGWISSQFEQLHYRVNSKANPRRDRQKTELKREKLLTAH